MWGGGNGSLQLFARILGGMMSNKSRNSTIFFMLEIFQKKSPGYQQDLKIRDLTLGTERIRAVDDIRGRENWHIEDSNKSQHIFDKLMFRKCPKYVLRNTKPSKMRSKCNTSMWWQCKIILEKLLYYLIDKKKEKQSDSFNWLESLNAL